MVAIQGRRKLGCTLTHVNVCMCGANGQWSRGGALTHVVPPDCKTKAEMKVGDTTWIRIDRILF